MVSLTAQAQTAHWITADDTLCNKPNTWMEFHKDFQLKKKPKQAVAQIAADSKYWLWVNGKQVVFEGSLKRGPNPTDSYFDSVDLARYLRKGSNDVRLLLCFFGKPGFSHVNSGQSGFILDASAIGLVSDRTWRSRRLPSYLTCGAPEANFRLAESCIRYDARLEGQGTFLPSRELGAWGQGPWGRLVERPIPMWRDSGVLTAGCQRFEDGDGNIVLTVCLPYNMQLTPFIDLTDENDGTAVRLETDHVRGGSDNCIRAEYITRRGRQQYESLGWMNGDELRVIYPKGARLTVHSVGYRETGYDCEREGTFTCTDPVLCRYWDKAMRTLYVNMRDNYFDCPDRERAQWGGDATILMGQSFYQLSPRANALMRKFFRELVDWQKPDSVLFSPIPAQNWNGELPAQSLADIGTRGFWEYYLQTGDAETMRYVYPAMRRYLGIWKLDADGLTAFRSGGWSWGDWGTDIDMRLLLAAWHYMALESAIDIARLTGNDEDVAGYERQRRSIARAFDRCWNGSAYRHPTYSGLTDDRVQALAVVSGLADSSRYEALYQQFLEHEQASPYMERYVLEALVRIGHGEYALERFKRRFGPMIDDTVHSTLYESWTVGGDGGGSVNHAWSGGMLNVFCEQVFGLRPTTAGWQTFTISPRPLLPEAGITVPTVRGTVAASFADSPTSLRLTLTVPKGTTADIVLPQRDYAAIRVNRKLLKRGQVPVLKAGKYEILCEKSIKKE